jgi:hypothetical protein
MNTPKYIHLRTVNPQVPGSSPGRGAKIQKPANESLRAFLLWSTILIDHPRARARPPGADIWTRWKKLKQQTLSLPLR